MISPLPVVPGPIIGAGTRGNLIDQARTMPNMRSAVGGWMRPMVVAIQRDRIVDGENKGSDLQVSGVGIIQPLSSEELKIKPEGDRSWKWVMLHCTDSILLQTNDQATIRGIRYKVMAKKDYAEYGYLRYELIETYRPNSP